MSTKPEREQEDQETPRRRGTKNRRKAIDRTQPLPPKKSGVRKASHLGMRKQALVVGNNYKHLL
jgi:hypothetical protein